MKLIPVKTDIQTKKETRNLIILVILTVVWFGFFVDNSITESHNNKELRDISIKLSTNNDKIYQNQQVIISNQHTIISNQSNIIRNQKSFF